MNNSSPWQFLADAVLCSHVALMLFVVLGLPLIIVGNLRRWGWINSPWLRFAHLAVILVVAGEAWLGLVCPLTTLEMWLRAKAHATTYEGSFVEHWLQALLFWQAPAWVFTAVYSLFGLSVLATWWLWPVRFSRARRATLA
jgi:polyferredoxin